ncbi:quinone methyltransferase [Sorangium cellulosum So ce56]|uniref:Quinone methyltransferase n=1 Tax=Sorangium cellulosum (strain So ce56) TaxID=448385 RepID=A9FJ99_SORC5|nr:methyltransferase domain-containing protein [Sorangium cellulosum]CAN91934.1 quinone methyltransferase [Sorangium cellulosum So ce56]
MTASIGRESVVPPSSSSGLPSWRSQVTFSMRVDQTDQEVALSGMLRPFGADQMRAIRGTLETAAKSARGELCLDFKRLKYMNNVAFLEINRFVRWAVEARPNLKIKLIISSVIPWAIRKFQVIAEIYTNVSVEIYDMAFYPIQRMLEDAEFIDVLRLQERIIWEHERKILPHHGLMPGMRIADIACGLGYFAVMLQKDFKPEYLVGVDHSRPSLRYAQEMAKRLAMEDVEYQYGDAATLLLPDNSFDFVACRLALQVFHQPEMIMQELYRICKPGGRIYITNEMMSCNYGWPDHELIRATYQRILELGKMVGMDLDIGMKTRQVLTDAGLEDLKINLIDITNMNTDCYDFARVVESWINGTSQMAATAGTLPEFHQEISAGLKVHMATITNPKGLASWPIYAGSGRKPVKMM